ncbi:gliding motility-associated C-terminal domain-containing protein [Belliella sp. DSM 107340]|uniref:Gliding motility-associated C-terminal domain-containing protein n=1 Tax=Belliella calami TaxID=2923436 RepID=A0ABS9UK94_9BACT|nr:gliding motility-associated C-terminal domain-containing protein [Belliella calami]MCH7397040.1 gliding motility-associated C-terminal domain-containing protein [Belliella calami]
MRIIVRRFHLCIALDRYVIALFLSLFLLLLLSPNSIAQNDNRVPFRHKVGNPAPDGNLYRIKGDFSIIGNSNLTLENYTDSTDNSANFVKFTDVDNDIQTLNSSSATLKFSEENNADPNCSEILYAGLYWSGRVGVDKGLVFEVTKDIIPGEEVILNDQEQKVGFLEEIDYLNQTLNIDEYYDGIGSAYPHFFIGNYFSEFYLQIRFINQNGGEVQFSFNDAEWQTVQNLTLSSENSILTATFDPIVFVQDNITFSIGKLSKLQYGQANSGLLENTHMYVVKNGVYQPMLPYTLDFDKRKIKLKGPNEAEYTEITADGNAILYPQDELANIYVGYSDVTQYVKQNGLGEYTVADIALEEGRSDNVGFFGHWGLIVVYQNSKMNWRDVTIFDGYSFVQSLDGQEHVGEVEIDGFGAVKTGQVALKLGLMAGEGDRSVGGDFLEIINSEGEWVRLNHPLNTPENFFNSTIYTPVQNSLGELVPTPRNPNFTNNIGVDILQWDISNPGNSIITNDQTSTRFRFGTKQDLYTIYAFAFSVLSYIPEVQVINQVESIDDTPVGVDPTIEPGQEITFAAEIRNKGSEEVSETKIIIPIPFSASFVKAFTTPENYGTVSFDPDMGISGSLIWDIGDLPLMADADELIATLKYTLKVTEDCVILANTSCEANISMTGSVSGVGKVSENVFTNLPFVSNIRDGECIGEEIFDPIEIPIVGRNEFVLANCTGSEQFGNLLNVDLPDFCKGDTPANLKDLISPSQSDFQVYFFENETGGTPILNYFVNTSVIGTSQIWVSEGFEGSCTGIRIPIEMVVLPKSSVPTSSNILVCIGEEPLFFNVNPDEGYTLNYYTDNNPSSTALDSVPVISSKVDGQYSIWVSQSKDDECESNRKEVRIRVYDCSLISDIKVTIVPDNQIYENEGQVVNFLITVENVGDLELSNVFLMENLMGNNWTIPNLSPGEKMEFSFQYFISEENMLIGAVAVQAYTSASSLDNGFIDDSDDATIFKLPLDFMDYKVTSEPATCIVGIDDIGAIIVEFLQGPQTGFLEIRDLSDIQLTQVLFNDTNLIKVEVPSGQYKLVLTTALGYTVEDSQVYNVSEKESVKFDIVESVFSCDTYSYYPTSSEDLVYEIIGSNGTRIPLNSDKLFVFTRSDSYKIIGKDPKGIKCPVEKNMIVEIQELFPLELQFSSFCQNDLFTDIELLNPEIGATIKWFTIASMGNLQLFEFDDNPKLMVETPGFYQVILTNSQGCVIGKRDFEVKKTFSDPPKMNGLYSICPTKEGSQTISLESQFVENHWFFDGEEVSQELVFSPKEEGLYRLVTIDQSGCEFMMDFEVEINCEPTLKYSNAIRPGHDGHGLVIFPDNLIDAIEIQVFNRWGELIFFCEDKHLRYGEKSSCFWDGFVKGKPAITGSYSLLIRYKLKEEEGYFKKHDLLFIIN